MMRGTDALARGCEFHGFPVVAGETLLGFVARSKLLDVLGACVAVVFCVLLTCACDGGAGTLLAEENTGAQTCTFAVRFGVGGADLSALLEDALQLRKEIPLELVLDMFRKLVRPSLSLLLGGC